MTGSAAQAEDATLIERIDTEQQAIDYSPAPEPEALPKEEAGHRVEEFRVRGRLETLKIMPENAPAMYIKDRAGDGSLEDPVSDMEADHTIPMWRIGGWN
jgi:hypothetical protein